tara:strand:- start:593 stop:1762 length:1170 start_codon:yes stop_codon:yes gene_type:complete
MALSITQTPALVSLAQSPIIFTLAESTPVYTSSSFQYVGELFYWTGSLTNSSSAANYTITKYPNTQNVGIFDLNRIINSTLTSLAIANTSNVEFFAVDFYYQWLSGSIYVTGSHTRSSTYKALDGYGVFQEAIGAPIYSSSIYWPLMTDGPATQSAFIDNTGMAGVYWDDDGETSNLVSKIVYNSNLGTANYNVTGSTSTSGQIAQYPIGPAQSGFPLSTTGLEWFSVQPYYYSTANGAPIRYNIDCIQKYPNVRIKWKNRYGQFDYFNFYMVSKESFETEKRNYQPQLGTWEGSTLSYQNYDTGNQAYIVDSKQGLSVNSFWISQDYNDILKQLLVSDEIYWVYDEANNYVRPITIVTQNIVFKTGVVDGLIQYQFDFQYGQPYKLIL